MQKEVTPRIGDLLFMISGHFITLEAIWNFIWKFLYVYSIQKVVKIHEDNYETHKK